MGTAAAHRAWIKNPEHSQAENRYELFDAQRQQPRPRVKSTAPVLTLAVALLIVFVRPVKVRRHLPLPSVLLRYPEEGARQLHRFPWLVFERLR